MTDVEHEDRGEYETSSVKELIEQAAGKVEQKRLAAKRAKAELKEAEQDYATFIREQLSGKRARISGSIAYEELHDQDGLNWFPAYGSYSDTEVLITHVFTGEKDYHAKNEQDPLIYMSIIGQRRRGIAMFLSGATKFELIEEKTPDDATTVDMGAVALHSL